MLVIDHEERAYSHVCVECETAHLVTASRTFRGIAGRVFDAICLTAMFLLLVLFFFWSVAGLGLIFLGYLLYRKRKMCPACKSFSLIPIDSPRGLKIMEKNGWKAL